MRIVVVVTLIGGLGLSVKVASSNKGETSIVSGSDACISVVRAWRSEGSVDVLVVGSVDVLAVGSGGV